MNNDLISKEALKKAIDELFKHGGYDSGLVMNTIDNAPTVQPKYFPPCEDCNKKMEEIRQAYDKMKAMERPHDKWIPVTYRPLTAEERIAFAEHYGIEYCDTLDEKAFDCPMPEDCQEILISTSWGVVEDVADNDIDGEGFICYGLEINGDWDGVDAWMPKPEPYKKGEEERMNTEDDIKQCRTEGIPNEVLILNRLQNAEILDDYATKLAQGDDVASGRMSVAEYEAVISALSYAVSYMRGAL